MPESARHAGGRLTRLLADAHRPALVGLAKNTGKTETLTAILAEHAATGQRIGVTSIGRDGEEHDVIDARIVKPRIELQAGSLVASTGALLRTSDVAHERLVQTGVRTPLGEVLVARLTASGTVEVAGPSAAEDVRSVCEAMAAYGAERVLIDGAIDRRAASSPAISDGLVLATGAVLGREIEQVVATTGEAVDLVRLPVASAGDIAEGPRLERRLVLSGEETQVAGMLQAHPHASTFVVDGALGERFLQALVAARRERSGRELKIVAGDPTKVFLSRHGPRWYERQGISIAVVRPIDLRAITVNPVAPQSHRFDSPRLREAIEAAIAGVPVLDVRDPA